MPMLWHMSWQFQKVLTPLCRPNIVVVMNLFWGIHKSLWNRAIDCSLTTSLRENHLNKVSLSVEKTIDLRMHFPSSEKWTGQSLGGNKDFLYKVSWLAADSSSPGWCSSEHIDQWSKKDQTRDNSGRIISPNCVFLPRGHFLWCPPCNDPKTQTTCQQ